MFICMKIVRRLLAKGKSWWYFEFSFDFPSNKQHFIRPENLYSCVRASWFFIYIFPSRKTLSTKRRSKSFYRKNKHNNNAQQGKLNGKIDSQNFERRLWIIFGCKWNDNKTFVISNNFHSTLTNKNRIQLWRKSSILFTKNWKLWNVNFTNRMLNRCKIKGSVFTIF